MKLNEFIDIKIKELDQSNLYKDIRFDKAIDIILRKNVKSENFIAVDSDMNKNIVEVINFSVLEDIDKEGSKVTIDMLKKGKRKYESKKYYVLFK